MHQSRLHLLVSLSLACAGMATPSLNAQSQKTKAQHLVEITVQKHSEITGLELSAVPPGKEECVTIAATEMKDLGEKCDEDEATALKTLKPFVEHEPDGFDVTTPIHDASGTLIGTLGIDFRPKPGQTKKDVLKSTAELLKEMEKQIPSKDFLFQPAS